MKAGAVSLTNVTKVYPGTPDDARPAVEDVSIETDGGEILTLLGSSGSGKSTTLRIIAGLEKLTSGEVRIDGQIVSSPTTHVPTHKRRIGMVFQSYAVWPHMTVLDNVAFPLKVAGVPKRERHARARETLGEVSLTEYADRLPAQLSGGQQQRVALARAIVGDPGIILYDEPLSNLDARLRDRLRERIRALHERLEITAIYVTHDQREAMAISDRVAMMELGTLQQIGTPQELYLTPMRRNVAEFVGDANMLRIAKLDRSAGTVFLSDQVAVQVPPMCITQSDGADDDADDDADQFLMIRPQHVSVLARDDTPDSPDTMVGTVTSTRFFGDHVRVAVALDEDVSIVAELVPRSTIAMVEAGQPVRVMFDSGLVSVVS